MSHKKRIISVLQSNLIRIDLLFTKERTEKGDTGVDKEYTAPPSLFLLNQGFEGLNCEINFDDCSYGFCKNNSTCLDLVADYACVCPPGFMGKV